MNLYEMIKDKGLPDDNATSADWIKALKGIEVDEEAVTNILFGACDTDYDEALMYSKDQAEILSQSPEIFKEVVVDGLKH